MDRHLNNLIDEAINCLNWDVIIDNYRDYEQIVEKKKRPTTTNSIKTDLRNLCRFMIENNISYFDQEQFIVTWRHSDLDDKLGSKLEILYVPTRSCAYENEAVYEVRDDEAEDYEAELMALERLLDNAVESENYELAAVLRDRVDAVRELVPVK